VAGAKPVRLPGGNVDMHHFDPYSQALSKLERGFDQDLEDVRAMRERGLIDPPGLREFYARLEPELYRVPAISPAAFRRRVVEASSSPS